MAKFSKKTTEKIVGLIKSDTYTIAEICRQVGITPKTYHQWVNDYPDFADAIEQAKDEKGNPKPIIKEQTTTKKHIQADTAAIIFTLTNGDPEHWRNRQTTEVTGKDGKDLFASKTDEELAKDIEELTRKLQ